MRRESIEPQGTGTSDGEHAHAGSPPLPGSGKQPVPDVGGVQVAAAPGPPRREPTGGGVLPIGRIRTIVGRIESGFYDAAPVRQRIAAGLLADTTLGGFADLT